MIRRIKALTAVSPGELVDGFLSGLLQPPDDSDESLDILLKHAVRRVQPQEADAGRIWTKLRRRISGPFGQLAVEGPAHGVGRELAPFAPQIDSAAMARSRQNGAEAAAEARLGINLYKLSEEGLSLR